MIKRMPDLALAMVTIAFLGSAAAGAAWSDEESVLAGEPAVLGRDAREPERGHHGVSDALQ